MTSCPEAFDLDGLFSGPLNGEYASLYSSLGLVSRTASEHRIYSLLTSAARLRRFMEFHVWCVWDFMCLAKATQIGIGCYSLPWFPPRDALLVSYINQIVDSEEADIGPDGCHASHFEIYLSAMEEMRADTRPINTFLQGLKEGAFVTQAMTDAGARGSSIEFVGTTMDFCGRPVPHRVAALCLGREELVPQMLMTLSSKINQETYNDAGLLRWYVNRHIELDLGSHAPLSMQLLQGFAQGDQFVRRQLLEAGIEAIAARCRYLDAAAECLDLIGS